MVGARLMSVLVHRPEKQLRATSMSADWLYSNCGGGKGGLGKQGRTFYVTTAEMQCVSNVARFLSHALSQA